MLTENDLCVYLVYTERLPANQAFFIVVHAHYAHLCVSVQMEPWGTKSLEAWGNKLQWLILDAASSDVHFVGKILG